MNCYNECSRFFKSKNEKDLGNITQEGDCAYCLYWKSGPGRSFYNYPYCECNKLFREKSNLGTTFDVKSYDDVKNCLKDSYHCGVQYNTFTNTPVKFLITPDTPTMPCNPRKIWSSTFKYKGVM